MLNIMRRAWQRGRSLLPVEGFTFGRPLVLLQSDDWGRAGIRDLEGWEELRSRGVSLGERSYDFYSLETAEDVAALASLLAGHRDSAGRHACMGMNFIVANVDLGKVVADDFRHVYIRELTVGLPDGWKRPGLFEAYQEGVSAGVFSPAVHGTTHFCPAAVERYLKDSGERGEFLRTLWKAGVPYIHWRMPWIGFEYWDAESGFLAADAQRSLIDSGVEAFTGFFSRSPRSACAPGYRGNDMTHQAWARHGIRVAQNGPGNFRAPHFDENGILHLYRSMDFEPAAAPEFSVDHCLQAADDCFAKGLPAIISVHSINFHSTLKDFRSRTLDLLDQFLTMLEAKYRDLLYVCDDELYGLVDDGRLQSTPSDLRISVTKRSYSAREMAARGA